MGTSPGASWNLAELVACFPGLSMRQSFSEGVGGEGKNKHLKDSQREQTMSGSGEKEGEG